MSRRPVFEPEHEAFRDSVRRFLAAGATDFASAAAEHGFLGLAEAADPRFAAVMLEEAMAAGLPAVALAVAVHESFAPLMMGRDVPGLLAVADSGSVRAEAADGGWVLSGAAETVLNGQGADLLLVVAADGESELLFAVRSDAAGLHRAPAETLLGLEGADVADLRFDAVSTTTADRLDADLSAARAGHQLMLAVAAMAGARTALATTVEYVKQRKAFGRPIAQFENTRYVLAGLGARVAAVGSFVDDCLARDLRPDTAAAAKLCAGEVLAEAVDTGVQLHGGYGYMWEYPIARAYAAARFFRLHGGAGEQLDNILADAIGL